MDREREKGRLTYIYDFSPRSTGQPTPWLPPAAAQKGQLYIVRVVEVFWSVGSPVTGARDQAWALSAGLARTDPLLVPWDRDGLRGCDN